MNSINNHYLKDINNLVKTTANWFSKKVVLDFLNTLYSVLSEKDFLIYGSVAKELLEPQGKDVFKDLDLVSSAQMYEITKKLFTNALDELGIKYKYSYQEGYFITLDDGNLYLVNLIDREVNKTAYPRGVVTWSQYEFSNEQIEYYEENNYKLPCLASEYLDSSKTGNKPFYADAPKKKVLYSLMSDVIFLDDFKL